MFAVQGGGSTGQWGVWVHRPAFMSPGSHVGYLDQSLPETRVTPALSTRHNGVISLNDLRGPTVLGYMYGGIYSTVPATGNNTFSQTGASNQVFQITLTPT